MSAALVDQLQQRYTTHALAIVERAAEITTDLTKQAMSRRTGEMVEATSHTQPVVAGTLVMCQIRVDTPYAAFQDVGTGIYGPSGSRIFPTKPGGVLVFDWPAAGGVVYAKSVAGAPGRHFFAAAMPDRWAAALQASLGGPL